MKFRKGFEASCIFAFMHLLDAGADAGGHSNDNSHDLVTGSSTPLDEGLSRPGIATRIAQWTYVASFYAKRLVLTHCAHCRLIDSTDKEELLELLISFGADTTTPPPM